MKLSADIIFYRLSKVYDVHFAVRQEELYVGRPVFHTIKELIKRQLQDLYFNHHDDLWYRRLKANKLKEVDELVRIGLQEEAEKLMEDSE